MDRDIAAKEYKANGFDGGIFPLDITADYEPTRVLVDSYAGSFFEDFEPDEDDSEATLC